VLLGVVHEGGTEKGVAWETAPISTGKLPAGRGVDNEEATGIRPTMLSGTIREHLRAVPFEPFLIQMNDGRRFEVPHPDFAALSPDGTKVFVFRNNEDSAGVHLSALLVSSIEPLRSAAH
jgi:hypothetical protein